MAAPTPGSWRERGLRAVAEVWRLGGWPEDVPAPVLPDWALPDWTLPDWTLPGRDMADRATPDREMAEGVPAEGALAAEAACQGATATVPGTVPRTVPGTAPGTAAGTAAGTAPGPPLSASPEPVPAPTDERARLARLAAVVVPGIDYEAMAGVPRREIDWVATARRAVAEARARLDWLDVTRPERGLPPAPAAPPGLNARQARFAEALARGASGAEAARLAGYAPGAAAVTASRMLRNDKVCSYFSALRDHNRLAERAEVDELVGHLRWSLARGRAAQDAGLVIRSVEAIARLKRYGLAHAPWRLAPEGPAVEEPTAEGQTGGAAGRDEAGGG